MVRIITDSAADFEPAELEQLHITCIPLPVMFGQREYRENVDLSKPQFYELLLASEELPKTSQAAPQLLLDLFLEAKAQGDEAIYFCLSSALSGTYQTALITRESANYEGCHVLDTRNATGGQRMLVEYAAKLRDQGKTAAQIIEAAEALRSRIVLYACIDTLEYLYKGGRISHTAYKLGSLANIKPIIRVNEEGGISVPAKAMGMRKGMDMLCKHVTQQVPDPAFPFYVMYTNNHSAAEELAKKLEAYGVQIPDDRIIGVGAAIGSHIGPDACGFVYIEK